MWKHDQARQSKEQPDAEEGKDRRAHQFLLGKRVALSRFVSKRVLQTKPDSHVRELKPADHSRDGSH